MDAPWERSGPSLEEGREKYISSLEKLTKYSRKVIEKYVDEYINKNFDVYDRCPMGSDRGFWMCFDDNIKEIEELISKNTS